jgi:hypothetical protein
MPFPIQISFNHLPIAYIPILSACSSDNSRTRRHESNIYRWEVGLRYMTLEIAGAYVVRVRCQL